MAKLLAPNLIGHGHELSQNGYLVGWNAQIGTALRRTVAKTERERHLALPCERQGNSRQPAQPSQAMMSALGVEVNAVYGGRLSGWWRSSSPRLWEHVPRGVSVAEC